jgi:hypothetical protein
LADKGLKDAVLAETTGEQVTKKIDGDAVEARSTSRRIKTVEDLLRHIEADMSKYEVSQSEATKWECGDGEGGTLELHRVFVRLRPKAGPSVQDAVAAMIKAASREIRRPKVARAKKARRGLWSVVVMSDLHFGGRSWRHTTGSDYDLSIAARLVAETASRLLARSEHAERRSIVLAGDTLHFDTISGTTTGGTYIDRDSRLQKTIEVAVDAIAGVVEMSAETKPTDVLFVPGNHDTAMAWALQKIFCERYRSDGRITVNNQFTSRKYLTHGGNLLGIAHGDKGKKRLPGVMAIEAAEAWARCSHREWHVGHLHHQVAEVGTIDGVLVRTHPTIIPPDSWHVDMAFIGAERAMQGFVYAYEGGLHEMHMEYVRRAK